ncbi:N-6 DNA methylase [Streptomyces acidiscabies]|uniref:N-6 DNA methylase n=1 Tax=Streptomyces acidiscabies TaxID=42234 RepID=A0ABU4LWE4_9ACTN|nr:N-6 DNA methylase [Streptomyces acidiscabies]MDX3020045.1 N-6 DNA methylase [Streptomyces acidiscabies]
MNGYREIVKVLAANTGAKRMSEVFDNFVEMAALAVRNAVDVRGSKAWEAREARYLQIAGRYSTRELNRFAEALALVTLEMQREPCDVLGGLYMELELGNERLGQFYTPYDVARLMAEMQIDSVVEQVQRDGFAGLYEPACGAGGFIVALSQAMLEHGLNPQTQLHVTAEDIAPQAVHMIYVQLALLHIPAVVRRRNVLTLETFETRLTPAHVLGGWSRRLRLARGVRGSRQFLGTELRRAS